MKQRIKQFLSWWLAELKSLIPSGWLNWIQDKNLWVIVTVADEQIILHSCKSGSPTLLERTNKAQGKTAISEWLVYQLQQLDHSAEVMLRLADTQVLKQQITLPDQARKNLRNVLRYEIERLTPFKAEQVYFDYELDKNGGGESQFITTLMVTPRQSVDEYIAAIAESGLQVNAITITKDANDIFCEMPAINLLPPEQRPKKAGAWSWYNQALVMVITALLSIAVFLPMKRQHDQIAALQQQVEEYKAEAEVVKVLQNRIETRIAGMSEILQQKNQLPAVIAVLEELSQLLPDNTWLQRFNYASNHIVIQGESMAASELIGLLENSSYLNGVNFRSQVVENPRTGSERFHIEARLSQEEVI